MWKWKIFINVRDNVHIYACHTWFHIMCMSKFFFGLTVTQVYPIYPQFYALCIISQFFPEIFVMFLHLMQILHYLSYFETSCIILIIFKKAYMIFNYFFAKNSEYIDLCWLKNRSINVSVKTCTMSFTEKKICVQRHFKPKHFFPLLCTAHTCARFKSYCKNYYPQV